MQRAVLWEGQPYRLTLKLISARPVIELECTPPD